MTGVSVVQMRTLELKRCLCGAHVCTRPEILVSGSSYHCLSLFVPQSLKEQSRVAFSTYSLFDPKVHVCPALLQFLSLFDVQIPSNQGQVRWGAGPRGLQFILSVLSVLSTTMSELLPGGPTLISLVIFWCLSQDNTGLW